MCRLSFVLAVIVAVGVLWPTTVLSQELSPAQQDV